MKYELMDKAVVRESFDLIKSIFNLTNPQIKIFKTCLYNLQNDIETNVFTFQELYDIFQLEKSGTRRKTIIKAVQDIHNASYRMFDLEENSLTIEHFFDKAKIDFNKETVTFPFHNELIQRLKSEAPAALECLGTIHKFENAYSQKLYSLFRMMVVTNGNSFTVSLEELKNLLCGLDQYKNNEKDFIRYAFIPAIEELNDKSEEKFNYEFVKEKRKITHISFSKQIIDNLHMYLKRIKEYIGTDLTPQDISMCENWFKRYPLEKINEFLVMTEKYKNLQMVDGMLKSTLGEGVIDVEYVNEDKKDPDLEMSYVISSMKNFLKRDLYDAELTMIGKWIKTYDFELIAAAIEISEKSNYKHGAYIDKVLANEFPKHLSESEREQIKLETLNNVSEEEYQLSGFEDVDVKLHLMQKLEPINYLKYLKKVNTLSPKDQEIIEGFITISGLSYPVINAILYHSITNNNGELKQYDIEYWGSMMQRERPTDAYATCLIIKPKLGKL